MIVSQLPTCSRHSREVGPSLNLAQDRLDALAVREYAESVEVPTGGFRGGLWDEGDDVEYTFYGLGVISLTDN